MNRTIAGQAMPSRLPWPLSSGLPAMRRPSSLRALIPDARRMRILLVSMLAATPLLGGGWLWLRNSSFVAVRDVHVIGLHGSEAGAIEAALVGAARRMSTLDVHPGALIAAVAPFRVVQAVQVDASFPHGMTIRVAEQLPVAAVELGGIRTAVAADGAVLGPALLRHGLPSVSAGAASGSQVELTGQFVRPGVLREELTVLGAEPAAFAKLVSRAYEGPKGITIVLHGGLEAYFGDASLPHAKWLSLARVLLDSSSAGASYVDVRVPERPAAGFPYGATPQSALGTGGESGSNALGLASATEPTTAAELAAGLAAALGTSTSPASPSVSQATGAGAPVSSTPSESGNASQASTETAATSSTETAAPSSSESAVPSNSNGG